MEMMEHMMAEPLVLRLWLFWLMAINTAAILFVFHRVEARWVFAAWIANLIIMPQLYEIFGYTRILGLSHILVWTPLLIYLWRRRHGFGLSTAGGAYLWTLFASNAISLAFDYVDLARYLAGDRAM